MTPTFTVSVLAYGRIELTRPCVEAVLRHSRDYELILTDNNSQDGTKEFFENVRARYPDKVRVVLNTANLGFQWPNTNALNMANGEYLVLLNNDSIPPDGWLQSLHEPFKGNPKMAITGAAGGHSLIRPDFHGARGNGVEYVEGSCLMVRCDLVRKHGLFSPYISFIYGDDSDLSLRMRELGYQIALVPINIQHKQNATCKHMPEIKGIQQRNHAALRQRWAHYLKVRRMDYPIVIKRGFALGDVLLTTPLIRALQEQRPLCKIMVETQTPDVISLPGIAAGQRMPVDAHTLVIDLNMSYENMPETNIIDAYSRVAGITITDRTLTFLPQTADTKWAALSLKDTGARPVCAIHPGPTTWRGKNWSVGRWSEVITWLMQSWDVILVGAQAAPNIPCKLDMRGKTSISKLGALLFHCSLFVGLDSFPMHLARAMCLPAVVLFGATSPEYVLSDGPALIPVQGDRAKVPCIGERHRTTGKTAVQCSGACMDAITVDMVKAAIEQMVGVI